jgi:hypothetical protein
MDCVIRQREELLALHQALWKLRGPDAGLSFRLELPQLTAKGNQLLSHRINTLKNECGCFAGGLFMGSTCIILTATHLLSGRGVTDISSIDIVLLLMCLGGVSLLGKLVALVWARVRLIRVLRETLERVDQGVAASRR